MGRREHVRFWALAALLVAGAAAAYAVLLGREPATPKATVASADAAPVLAVTRVVGQVERVRGAERAPARAGDALRRDDALVAGVDGRVELSAGDSYTVELEGAARFDVQQITATLARFRLESGLVSARVREDPRRTVEFEATRGTVMRTRGGAVSMSRSGKVVAVAATEGAAELESAGTTVVVGAGKRATAVEGLPPSDAVPLPPELLLKVAWPGERTTNRARIVVRGRTEPGAVVVLGGEPVEVGPDGTFMHVLYLREGSQVLEASARGVGGRSSREHGPPVVLDTRAPDPRFDTRGLWGGSPR
ncbi:FecR domain-containing protein [Anaeromyxobacter oryzae]|uniref:FecR protein domain-containing protein n=1 Tax=Anaeromyxobacter oryzae TaxID=2918170 RepID=A0ABN6N490_9BACT|nr:FecR domain-containing protein [Anaeromyxobacter oryzae]BDG06828.1 hypothetical protein AMOR_58240 [Anaeromyxobacter oryzae]